jgi:CHASE2 domain-containing sensor protein
LTGQGNFSRFDAVLIKWSPGVVIGIFTAFTLVVTTTLFPSLQDYGIDIGLRVTSWLKQLPRDRIESSSFRYVFLDVDPGGTSATSNDTSIGACCSLERREAPKNGVAQYYAVTRPSESCAGTAASKSNSTETGGRTVEPKALHCQSTRPLNRFLIAEVLKTLAVLSDKPIVRALVLDVVLAEDSATDDEDKELMPAMATWKTSGKPVIFAADATLSFKETEAVVKLLSDQQKYPGELGVALPVADRTVRRYRKCFAKATSAEHIESLPYQVARAVNPDLIGCEGPGSGAIVDDTPRIIFAIPSLDAHADLDSRTAEKSNLLRAIYSPVYVHCLAAHLWDKNSHCSQPETYQNAIVVIGASNPFRRDRHITPLGEMAGAEVVINAVQSFLLYPMLKEKEFGEKFWSKIWITLACSTVWFFYFFFRREYEQGPHGAWPLIKCGIFNTVLYVIVFTAVLIIAVALAYHPKHEPPSLDVLIPVLAIGLELYAEAVIWIAARIRASLTWLATLFGYT